MAKESFSHEEVRKWFKWDEVEGDSHLKWAMGEVFYHELNCLSDKDILIKHLKYSLDKLTIQEALHHEELVAILAKKNEEATTHRK